MQSRKIQNKEKNNYTNISLNTKTTLTIKGRINLASLLIKGVFGVRSELL